LPGCSLPLPLPCCGRYFLIRNLGRTYKHGTFCSPHCNRAVITVLATSAKGSKRQRELLCTLTDALEKWPDQPVRTQQRIRREDWLLNQINKRIDPQIEAFNTRKWITRNLKAVKVVKKKVQTLACDLPRMLEPICGGTYGKLRQQVLAIPADLAHFFGRTSLPPKY
jgi:hypothetical protein